MSFTVKTGNFQGPLDLLLDLIEKRKVFVNDISLSRVTDEFIQHLKQFETIPIVESADFILIASTLLLIKSKSLLPELDLTDQEKEDIQNLETRLMIYRRFREISNGIGKIFGKKMIFMPLSVPKGDIVFMPDPTYNIDTARRYIHGLVQSLPKKESLPETLVKKVISLEEMITSLASRVTSHLRVSFKEFSSEHRQNKLEIIVGFLAMLELVKQGLFHVSQDKAFADIHMETRAVSVPIY